MIAATELRLVVVTPETTLVDKVVKSLRFPLFDGQIGVLPGRAPLVGRLGVGELKIDTATGSESFYIEGGFAQIKGSIVTLLTSRAMAAEKIDVSAAEKELATAQAMTPVNDEAFTTKQQMLARSRSMLSIKKR